jgi:hypothetical protein
LKTKREFAQTEAKIEMSAKDTLSLCEMSTSTSDPPEKTEKKQEPNLLSAKYQSRIR